jgi:hypothetical protein
MFLAMISVHLPSGPNIVSATGSARLYVASASVSLLLLQIDDS